MIHWIGECERSERSRQETARTHRFLRNGTRTDYTIDPVLDRVSTVQHFLTDVSPRFDYGFDEVSRRNYEQRNAGTADGFDYNLAGSVTKFNREGTLQADGTVTGGAAVTLGYDANGNRLSSYTSNNLNQYTDVDGANLTYGVNGNLSEPANISLPDHSFRFRPVPASIAMAGVPCRVQWGRRSVLSAVWVRHRVGPRFSHIKTRLRGYPDGYPAFSDGDYHLRQRRLPPLLTRSISLGMPTAPVSTRKSGDASFRTGMEHGVIRLPGIPQTA